jgi:spore maturation protein CgeB
MKISLWQSGVGFYETFRRWSAAEWRKLGHEVIPMPNKGDVRALGDVLFSMNFSPELARLARDLRKPYVCWIWDALVNYTLLNPEWASDYTILFSYSRGDMARFRKSGYRNVFYLPASTDATSMANQAKAANGTRNDIAFVGNCYPPTSSEFQVYRTEFLNHGLPPERGLRTLERFIEIAAARPPTDLRRAFAEFVAREEPNFFRLAPAPREAVDNPDAGLDYFVNSLLYHEVDIRIRGGVVKALAPLGIDLWGDEDGWRPFIGGGIRYRGVAGIETDVGRIAAESRINLNITRTISDGANMRSFEIPAAGGFQMALRTDEMESLYAREKEIALYSTPEEALDLAGFYLRHDRLRRGLAEAGHRRFLAEHTLEHRFQTMKEVLRPLGL